MIPGGPVARAVFEVLPDRRAGRGGDGLGGRSLGDGKGVDAKGGDGRPSGAGYLFIYFVVMGQAGRCTAHL